VGVPELVGAGKGRKMVTVMVTTDGLVVAVVVDV